MNSSNRPVKKVVALKGGNYPIKFKTASPNHWLVIDVDGCDTVTGYKKLLLVDGFLNLEAKMSAAFLGIAQNLIPPGKLND